MAAIISDLLLRISENHAQLTKGLNEVKGQVGSFTKGIQQVGGFIKTAFAATAVIGFGKQLFETALAFDDIIGKLDDIGQSIDLALNAGKVKAIADVFETDLDKVIKAANATAVQFGLSFNQSLDLVQKGIALAGPDTEKYLKSLESQAATFSEAGGSADQFFSIVTDGYRNSTNFEAELNKGAKATADSFNELVGQMNEGQRIQQQLVNSQASFNAELATLFDGTGDLVDNLKISLYDLATNALRSVKSAVVDTANYFIDLYNQSLAFRLIIQGLVATFETLWEIAKGFVLTLVNGFSTIGDLIKAVFTGNFQDIPNILRNALIENNRIFKEVGSNIYDAFKTGFENAVKNKPIKLIDSSSVLAPTQATNGIATGKNKQHNTTPAGNFNPGINLSTTAADSFVKAQQSLNQQVIRSIVEQNEKWKTLGETIQESIGNVAVNALNSLGDALASLAAGQKVSFKDLVKTVVGGVGQIIKAYLAEAIAGQIKSNAKLGLPGLALAAVGIAGVTALFSKIGKFKNGTDFAPGGLALVGEAGRELVNLPRGSQVVPNRQTESLLNGGRVQFAPVEFKIQGETLYAVLETVKGRR